MFKNNQLKAYSLATILVGGMAAGIDRIVMLLVGAHNLREVTMFPMNQQAQDLLMGAPGEADAAQLRELNLRLIPVQKD